MLGYYIGVNMKLLKYIKTILFKLKSYDSVKAELDEYKCIAQINAWAIYNRGDKSGPRISYYE